ncbi:MAG: hypothetical protein IPH20_23885 [Bacteroidales bacterium]|nr:hypothetical protein [Bacteroidales bacterium]
MMTANEKQAQFLRKIEDILPKNTSLVNELSDVLKISNDSAYRRMRGETFLVIDEILLLCNHFNVSFDSLNPAREGVVSFRYSKMEPSRESFIHYLTGLLKDLEVIEKAAAHRITYASEDIPVFHHYRNPVMSQFKIFYWMQAILNIPEMENEKFDVSVIDEELGEIGYKIYELYSRVPSVEVWTETTIQSTAKQIEFFWEAGKFASRADALAVCNSFRDEISDIQKQAGKSSKLLNDAAQSADGSINYQLYYSEIEITNNSVLIEMGRMNSVYMGHFSFSTMSTTSESYCQETRKWFDTIIRKSALISGVSEKQRYQVFKKYFNQIDALEQKISQG